MTPNDIEIQTPLPSGWFRQALPKNLAAPPPAMTLRLPLILPKNASAA